MIYIPNMHEGEKKIRLNQVNNKYRLKRKETIITGINPEAI